MTRPWIQQARAIAMAGGAMARCLEPGHEWPPSLLGWEHFALPPSGSRMLAFEAGSETVIYVLRGALSLGNGAGRLDSAVVAGGAQWLATDRRLQLSQRALGGVPAEGIRFRRRARPSDSGVVLVGFAADRRPFAPAVSGDGDAASGGEPFPVPGCFDISLGPGEVLEHEAAGDCELLIYLLAGTAAVGGQEMPEGAAWMAGAARRLRIEAREACRLVGWLGPPAADGAA